MIDYERIAKAAKEVGAYLMVDMAHVAGLVAAKVIPSPIPHADFVTSSTTKTFCSARSGMVFSKAEHAKINEEALGTQVPFNFLQPIVENAFIHGFAQCVRKKLKLVIDGESDRIGIKIINSGRKLSPQICYTNFHK